MSEHEDREFPLGAARAGFVASVRRKASAMRALLPEVAQTPKRDELRRKLHALGSGARSLHLDALERAVSDMMGRLDRTPREGVLVAADVEVLERTLAELPALAWGREDVRVTAERAIVAFGEPQFLGDLGPNVDCERTLDRAVAVARARELSIDALVIDADADGAFELCADLLDDEVTQDLTVIVVGAFGMPGDDARFIALGARFVVNKPLDRIGLKELLDEALAPPIAVSPFGAELGTPSLEELSSRLGEELRRGLLAVGRATDREKSVPLGEGVEVYAALWGAIARIREVVTAKTKGELAFTDPGPYGAVAMAPSLELDTERSMRNRGTRRGMGSEDVPLTGRRILVVDDDPGVTWFMADLLRSQGCLVDEALDGEQGLLRAYAAAPELVISDILMPKLDGPSLCRALGRDLVLQHTPVVLLSWKEDLMQRVRELGSSASAFLRKESDVRAVVARVQEVLRPRARLEARFLAGGPVRGRLDGFTVSAFVDMVQRFRSDVCISIRDAAFLYELEIRGGAPRSAVRSSGDGTVLSGMNAFRALLGVSSGRFSVEDRQSAIEDELQGSFRELSMAIVSERRAVIHALSEDRLVEAAAMDVHDERLRDVLRGMPARTGVIAGRILAGASPRELLLRDRIDPSELLDVLLHLARRGAILSVRTAEGQELSVPITLPHFDVAEETRLSRRPPPVVDSRAASETPDPDGMAMLLTRRLTLPPKEELTDIDETTYGHDVEAAADAARVSTSVDHTLYGGRLVDLPAPFPILTPSPKFALESAELDAVSVPIHVAEEPVVDGTPTLRAPQVTTSVSSSDVAGPGPMGEVDVQVDADAAPVVSPAAPFAHGASPRKRERPWLSVAIFGAAIALGVLCVRGFGGETRAPASPEPSDEPVPAGMNVKTSEGVIDVDVPPGANLRVDGVDRGSAEHTRIVVPAGIHTVSTPGATRAVDVRSLRLTKVRFGS